MGIRRVQYINKAHIHLTMRKNVYVDNRHISKKFIILDQKCPINLKYMCRFSDAHHVVRQQFPHHILGVYVQLYTILLPYNAFIYLNCILKSVHFLPKMDRLCLKKSHPLSKCGKLTRKFRIQTIFSWCASQNNLVMSGSNKDFL